MLAEKWRPRLWQDVAGNAVPVRRLRGLVESPAFGDSGGQAFWFEGPSGVGKTSLAHVVRHALKIGDMDLLELNGDRCKKDWVKHQAGGFLRLAAWTGKWKAIIVNEAHNMTRQAVQAWLTLLESMPKRRVVIFTSTKSIELASETFGDATMPFLSRCKRVSLESRGQETAFAERLKTVAEAEGLPFTPVGKYIELVKESKGNLRLALQELEMRKAEGPPEPEPDIFDEEVEPNDARFSLTVKASIASMEPPDAQYLLKGLSERFRMAYPNAQISIWQTEGQDELMWRDGVDNRLAAEILAAVRECREELMVGV